jgi:hypothetical protein
MASIRQLLMALPEYTELLSEAGWGSGVVHCYRESMSWRAAE